MSSQGPSPSHAQSSSLKMDNDKTVKTMSSRLLTMKFIQRAAASSTNHEPVLSSPEPGNKRRRVSRDAHVSVPSRIDDAMVRAAQENERLKEIAGRENLERLALSAGDSHWVLQLPGQKSQASSPAPARLRIVEVGYAQLDASDDVAEAPGRRSFNAPQPPEGETSKGGSVCVLSPCHRQPGRELS